MGLVGEKRVQPYLIYCCRDQSYEISLQGVSVSMHKHETSIDLFVDPVSCFTGTTLDMALS